MIRPASNRSLTDGINCIAVPEGMDGDSGGALTGVTVDSAAEPATRGNTAFVSYGPVWRVGSVRHRLERGVGLGPAIGRAFACGFQRTRLNTLQGLTGVTTNSNRASTTPHSRNRHRGDRRSPKQLQEQHDQEGQRRRLPGGPPDCRSEGIEQRDHFRFSLGFVFRASN